MVQFERKMSFGPANESAPVDWAARQRLSVRAWTRSPRARAAVELEAHAIALNAQFEAPQAAEQVPELAAVRDAAKEQQAAQSVSSAAERELVQPAALVPGARASVLDTRALVRLAELVPVAQALVHTDMPWAVSLDAERRARLACRTGMHKDIAAVSAANDGRTFVQKRQRGPSARVPTPQ